MTDHSDYSSALSADQGDEIRRGEVMGFFAPYTAMIWIDGQRCGRRFFSRGGVLFALPDYFQPSGENLPHGGAGWRQPTLEEAEALREPCEQVLDGRYYYAHWPRHGLRVRWLIGRDCMFAPGMPSELPPPQSNHGDKP